MDAPAWISAICAVIAVVTTVTGVVLTAKHEKNANKAAAEAIEFASRMAIAQGSIAESLEASRQEAAKLTPSWEVTRRTGILYCLKNCCSEDAHNLTIITDSAKYAVSEMELLSAGSTMEFRAILVMGSSSKITVTWNRPPELHDPKLYRWEGTLPAN